MRIRSVLESIGVALLVVSSYVPLLTQSNLVLYHHSLPIPHLIGSILVDLLCVAILALCLLMAIDRLPQNLQKTSRALFAGFMLWRLVDVAIFVYNAQAIDQEHSILFWVNGRKQICLVTVLLSCAFIHFFPRVTEHGISVIRLVIAAYAFSSFWIVPELLHLALVQQPNRDAAFTRPPIQARDGSNRRIVWIIFDELSYAQAFEHPAADITLPNFDRLRDTSFSFSNLWPAGFYTERIIPSLFLGQRINQIRSAADGSLWYKGASEKQWRSFDPSATLFGMAQRNGWNPGIDGWYNPYCRILRPVLTDCSWKSVDTLPMEQNGALEEKSVLDNAAVLPKHFLQGLTGGATTPAQEHIDDYQSIMANAPALIGNNQIRFVFLHLPIPHPPGIYDRKRQMLRGGGSYLDNLMLADTALKTMIQEIDATTAASQTTLIVSSDHSWRVPMWRPTGDWTKEEERASGGGRFDDRPVLLIHFPGQTSGEDVNASLSELLEHDIIADMLRGALNNQNDLERFIARNHAR